MSSLSGVHCKRASVSRLVWELNSQYRCRLVCRTPCACSPVLYGSVLIVVVREYIVVSGSVSAPRPPMGVGGLSVLCSFLGAGWPIYLVCMQVLDAFFLACAESRKNS